jgi:hypothetical protein
MWDLATTTVSFGELLAVRWTRSSREMLEALNVLKLLEKQCIQSGPYGSTATTTTTAFAAAVRRGFARDKAHDDFERRLRMIQIPAAIAELFLTVLNDLIARE